MHGARLTLSFFLFLEHMTLDVKRPELCPSPFKIYQATDMVGLKEGEKHNGFILAMRTEIQDMVGGSHFVRRKNGDHFPKKVPGFKFKAWVAGDQEIRVSAPQLSWSDRGNDDLLISANYEDETMICAALDVARNDYIQRAGLESYEAKEKIYVLRLMETGDMKIKLDGTVLESNRGAKKKHQEMPGLLSPFVLNLTTSVSTPDDDLEVLALKRTASDGTRSETQVTVWKVAQVPRLLWQVANVAVQARRVGVMEEDEEAEEEDDIMKQMSKKVAGIRIGNNPFEE